MNLNKSQRQDFNLHPPPYTGGVLTVELLCVRCPTRAHNAWYNIPLSIILRLAFHNKANTDYSSLCSLVHRGHQVLYNNSLKHYIVPLRLNIYSLVLMLLSVVQCGQQESNLLTASRIKYMYDLSRVYKPESTKNQTSFFNIA